MTNNIIDAIKSFELIANTNSKNEKIKLLDEYKSNDVFVSMLAWYLNPFIMTGLASKKFSKQIDLQSLSDVEDISKKCPTEMMDWLHKNNTGSNSVIISIRDWIKNQPEETHDFWQKFVTKSFKLGMSESTANKAYGSNFLPKFDVQLAFLLQDKINKVDGKTKYAVTQKLDGVRCLTTVEFKANNDLVIKSFTRQGALIEGLTELHTYIKSKLYDNVEYFKNENFVKSGIAFDGELVLLNPDNLTAVELFQLTSKALRTKGEKHNVTYNLFDIVPLTEFELNEFTEPYATRRKHLDLINEKFTQDENSSSILLSAVPVLEYVTNIKEIEKWSDYAEDHNWEGVMINNIDSLYKKSRTPNLLKVKKFFDADLECVGVYEGDSRLKGNLGGIIVKLNDNYTVNVGSGFSDDQRKQYWENPDTIVGKVVEVKYFEVTHNRNGGMSLRYPTFTAVRFDKSLEDVNIISEEN